MKTKSTFIKFISLIGLSLFVLTACSGGGSQEDPDAVIQKFKEAVKEIKSVDGNLKVSMKGMDAGDNIDFNLEADIKIDQRNYEEKKADINISVDGSLEADGNRMDGKVSVGVRMSGEEFYFNLNEIDVSDPRIDAFKPILDQYKGKWLHLASDFVPENIRELQEKDEETLQKEADLKQVFVESDLFEVNKQFGVESLNGKKVHHYGVVINEEGLKSYIRKSASINGTEMTDAEVNEAAAVASSVTNIELWIGTKDYYLYKGELELLGSDEETGIESDFSIAFTANSYNSDVQITAPAEFEEFNPLSLMMGMGALQGSEGGSLDLGTGGDEFNPEDLPVE